MLLLLDAILEVCRPKLEVFGAIWGALGGHLRGVKAQVGTLGSHLGGSWGNLGGHLGGLGGYLDGLRNQFGQSWPKMSNKWPKMMSWS